MAVGHHGLRGNGDSAARTNKLAFEGTDDDDTHTALDLRIDRVGALGVNEMAA